MRIGIVTIKDAAYHPNRRLLDAAKEKGHSGRLVHPYHTWPAVQGNRAVAIDPRGQSRIDALLPRQGAEVGESSLALIDYFEQHGLPVVNRSEAIRLARNQYLTICKLAEAGLPVLDSVLINSEEGFWIAVESLGGFPLVIKHPSGRQGEGIRLARDTEDGRKYLAELLTPRLGLMVQSFVPPEDRLDIRVLVIGGETAGAMALQPLEGDFRANFHLTGRSQPVDVWPELAKTAVRAASGLDLEIAGVDLLADPHRRLRVLEVNYAPGFQGLEAATGLDVAGMMVDYIVDTYGKK